VGEIEVEEDGGDDGRIGKERDDPHLSAAGGTEQRQHVVDAREQDGPANSRERGPSGSGCGRRGDIGFGCWCFRDERGPADGHDVGPEPGIGSEHTVVAMPMHARGWDELGERLEEFERG
jgi:hypothetical protein